LSLILVLVAKQLSLREVQKKVVTMT
jgi:hypothetical protein